MAMAAAAATFMERVEPYCSMRTALWQAARRPADMPADSWPKTSTHRSGSRVDSSGAESGGLSTATIV